MTSGASPESPSGTGSMPRTDSAGVPWHGRDLAPNPFSGDDGEADAELLALLHAHAAGTVAAQEVVAALAGTRLLVPVVAQSGDEHPLPDQLRGDLGAEMSIPLIGLSSGSSPATPARTALPAFTSQAALVSWLSTARPVPVEAERAALSAVDEGCVALVIDAGSPHVFTVNRPALWALAQGQTWVPALRDQHVQTAIQGALAGMDAVVAVRLEPGTHAEVCVVLSLRDVDADEFRAVMAEVTRRLGNEPMIAERIDSLQLRPVKAGAT